MTKKKQILEEGINLAWHAWSRTCKLMDKREGGEVTDKEADKEESDIRRQCYIALGKYTS